ncbi:DUF4396 domain-containing protein [Mameliella sp. CS4]|uniref:DUF4396 domain-containing protein n=1 Tax=Mameliella sp. CS4 TaxID=2862329 RepID=UPI001C5FDA6A|nr:DUF4396 domain-containing protein [Mameliella sp. CS4]MBW4982072.1 DUF4396 domain-containing protein [Mameliella sp. CS4]
MEHQTHTPAHHEDAQDDGHDNHATWPAAFWATVHCATGCVSGEVLGLVIGVSLGLSALPIIALTTSLALLFGLTLASVPLARRLGVGLGTALGMVWLGETVSILTMETVMNGVDYLMGGMSSGTVWSATFWLSMAIAIPIGFIATLPVNYVMIGRGIANHDH